MGWGGCGGWSGGAATGGGGGGCAAKAGAGQQGAERGHGAGVKACLHIANSLFGKQEAGELNLFQINRFPREKERKEKKNPTHQLHASSSPPQNPAREQEEQPQVPRQPRAGPTLGCVGSRGVCPCLSPAVPRPTLAATVAALSRPRQRGRPSV